MLVLYLTRKQLDHETLLHGSGKSVQFALPFIILIFLGHVKVNMILWIGIYCNVSGVTVIDKESEENMTVYIGCLELCNRSVCEYFYSNCAALW